MNCPLITIGLTSYNCESTIKNAIKSAISQSWENKEIIIVDDFSTDNSVEIIRSIDFKNIKHKLFFEPENKGLPSSLNKIIKNANVSRFRVSLLRKNDAKCSLKLYFR